MFCQRNLNTLYPLHFLKHKEFFPNLPQIRCNGKRFYLTKIEGMLLVFFLTSKLHIILLTLITISDSKQFRYKIHKKKPVKIINPESCVLSYI